MVSAWSLIADSLLLRVPGLCSLPREFRHLFVSPTFSEIARQAFNSINNSFRLDLIWAIFAGLLKIIRECFYGLKCDLYIGSAENISNSPFTYGRVVKAFERVSASCI